MLKRKISQIVKRILALAGYSILKTPQQKRTFLENVFSAKHSKKVLISYITQPFIHGIKLSHTNYLECYTAAEIFHEMGYCVDVIDYMENRKINYSSYAIVYGFGHPLENAFYSGCAEDIIKIFYSTGANPFYSNKHTALKILQFKEEKRKIIPQSGRFVEHFWPLQYIMPDLNICLGNQFVANTYLEINPNINIKSLSIFYYDVYDIDLSQKDFYVSKKHFLWFGSSGLLHKGLDVLIDIFSERNDIILHICGAPKGEKKFFDYYQQKIDSNDNIIDHGFVDMGSDSFKKTMDLCAFILFPSVSEGCSPAVVNVMANGGLIPIISNSAGLDVKESGFVFNDFTQDTITNKVNEALNLSEEKLRERALKIKSKAREEYSHKKYKQHLREILSKAESCLEKGQQ